MKKIASGITVIAISMMAFLNFSSCKKTEIDIYTTSDLNIYPYLQSKSEFSEWVKIIDKSGYAGFLTAYGSYTMFAPNNDAVKLYLTEVGKTSVDLFTEAEAKNIVKLHLMQDTIPTSQFKDGKLPTITMYGQYLVTGVTNVAGVSSILVNRQAILLAGNVHTGNGLIHTLDHVLKPAVKSTAQIISDDPNFSIFKQALIATGFYDTLNNLSTTDPKRLFTVLAETNKALADSGFTTYNALFTKLSNTGNPKNPADSLYIYMAYHIIPSLQYLADIASASSQYTLQPLEVLSTKLDGEVILINELEFNGVVEKGIAIDRAASDISTTTGVLHAVKAHFRPKTRIPSPVYWDVADFPEVRALPAFFRKAGTDFNYGAIKDITWNSTSNRLSGGNSSGTGYRYFGLTNASYPVVWGDALDLGLGTTSRHNWVEFTTPLLIKGKYNIWICYRASKQSGTVGVAGGSNLPVQWEFDGVPTSRQQNMTLQRPDNSTSDGEMLALGWKRYTVSTLQALSGKLIGAVDVTTTSRHKLRLVVLPAAGTGQNINILDMIHFIPVDWPSQYLPRFAVDGTPVYL
jgi:uncharacterized surface protein with fasciclin (FAS1) repeats